VTTLYLAGPEAIEYARRLDGLEATELAWFAGWLCADGSIKNHGNGRASIVFQLTDRDPLERFAEMFGNEVKGPYAPTGLGRKPRYSWSIRGHKATAIIERIRPWLSRRYLERFEALDHAPRKRGKVLTPADVADIKARLGEWGAARRLAKQYGVSEGLVSAIKLGRVWSDVTAAHAAQGGEAL
jgi:hypothetical protein